MSTLIFEPPWLCWDDRVYGFKTWRARAGPHGSGSLPAGTYRGRNLRLRTNASMNDRSGVGWSLDLEPLFITGRTLLRIHPDGNVPGSLGCIAVSDPYTHDLYQSLEFALRSEGGEINVEVVYESRVS